MSRNFFKALLPLVAGCALLGVEARGQGSEQHVTVTVIPAQTVDERVADEFREKDLKRAEEEKRAAAESARLAEKSPRLLLSRSRTLYVSSGTSFFEPVQLQNELLKRAEFEELELAIIDDWEKRNVADLLVEIDRPLFTYTFTYKITHRSTGIVLATGKLTAFDGNAAAPKLAKRIVEEIQRARGVAKTRAR